MKNFANVQQCYIVTYFNTLIVGGGNFIFKKRRNVARSFRLEEEWLNVLNEEAKKQGITTNALANKVLKDYSQYHRFSKRFGVITLTTQTVSALVDRCPKEFVIEMAKSSVLTKIKNGMRTIGVPPSYEAIVYFIKNILGEHTGWFTWEHHIKKDKEVFHLSHKLGNNWSIYIAEVVSKMFEYFLNEKVETEVTPSSATITRKRNLNNSYLS